MTIPPTPFESTSDKSAAPIEPIPAESLPESGGGATRRGFVLASLAVLLTGCSTPPRSASRVSVPGPSWRTRTPSSMPPPRDYRPTPAPGPGAEGPSGLIARSSWAGDGPALSRMNRMLPVQHITVHHDGISPFYDTDQRAAAARLESIRRYHRDTLGWGDIGYHYAIDRAGRIYECRSLTHQGAHVKNFNEGNIGVMLMGNFEQQAPSNAQVDALSRQLSWLMRRYNVPINRIRTHREWDGARTACPGSSLQAFMNTARARRMLG